ncbi:hypothetical protein M997_1818 [Proteus hauseri ATCC 700826]|uniref:N-acetyltransferase domain-containing protein n=1 Tax=Proteus hauseri ATCC 700826 TaxID=1354271 RepID=A0AAJ3HT67_PROHU|nr:hypothetical protein M997_1818 [Proteus hauseri ATCC 700826]
MLNLYVAIDRNKIIYGVLGTVENKLEMLFVSADRSGHGCGKLLLKFTVEKLKIRC